jgi:serine/threonine protein kinase
MSQPQNDPSTSAARPPSDVEETRTHDGGPTASASDGGDAVPSAPVLPAIPGYVVEQFVASGGQGEVFRARHLKLDRLVALKLLRRAINNPEDLARFTREGKLSARLDHPNFIRIFDYAEHDGRLYFSMEFAEGGSLKTRLAAGALAPRAAAELVATLAAAIHYAHEQGVIHRDLKPGNVLFTKAGTPKIADFGLAKQLDTESTELTRDQSVLGSARYMAPEQAAGKSKQVNPSTDVYALGNILYEILCGKPPFEAEDWLEILIQIRTADVPALREHVPDLPPLLHQICMRCLEKDPSRRFASAAELAAALRAFLADTPLGTSPAEDQSSSHLQTPQPNPPQAPTADASEPPRLPGYEILEKIGRGTVGAVYKARQSSLSRIVAIKMILLTAANRERWVACQEDIRRIVGLTHPNLVHVFDLVEAGNQAFIISEYLPGGTLQSRPHGPNVSCRDAVKCIEQASHAVAAAHRLGVVHRDLRASNMLYAAPGDALSSPVKVSDFGISLLENSAPAAVVRTIKQTPRAPELQAGAAATPATDVFALGALLYELLTGRQPGLGVSEALRAVKRERPPTAAALSTAPSELREDVPPALDAICAKALDPDPARRYPTAAEWATDLRRFLDGKKPHAQARGLWDRLRFWE